MPPDAKIALQRLQARKQELSSLREISADARDTVALDQQSVGRLSRMDAMQQQAMAEATERQRAGELLRIEAALARLEDGEYGYCERCGEEIPDKRLEIDPSVATCVDCAAGG
ncbi:MAG: TraR/DksA family transcriptional regulator [Hyphomicrobiaceae bacterium]